MDLALNNLQRLIRYKTQQTKQKSNALFFSTVITSDTGTCIIHQNQAVPLHHCSFHWYNICLLDPRSWGQRDDKHYASDREVKTAEAVIISVVKKKALLLHSLPYIYLHTHTHTYIYIYIYIFRKKFQFS